MDATVSLPALDEEGYLVEPGEWNEAVAEQLALAEDVRLTDEHWDVIRFMREYYEEHQIAPDARYVIKHLSNRLGADARNALFKLFAYGCQAGMQDRRDETATRLEHGLILSGRVHHRQVKRPPCR